MSVQRSSKHCAYCGEKVLAIRQGPNHVLHLLMSLVTMGLWLPIWLLSSVIIGGWQCSRCGRKV